MSISGLIPYRIGVGLRWFIQKFYFEPMFKAKCKSCGNNLRIDIGMPQLSKNLNISVGNNVSICGVNSFFAAGILPNPTLVVGDNSYIGFQVSISVGQRVILGKNCLLAARVAIMDNNNHPIDPERRRRLEKVTPDEIEPVVIEDNVWLGYQSFIGKGVRIGQGSIVAANSVVIKNVPAKSIVSGVPARIVANL